MNYSPWPRPGRWFRFERFEAWKLTVNYGEETHKQFHAEFGRWWFFSWNIAGLWHGYIGHKPVNLRDPKFQTPPDFSRERPAVEWSTRMGIGDIE